MTILTGHESIGPGAVGNGSGTNDFGFLQLRKWPPASPKTSHDRIIGDTLFHEPCTQVGGDVWRHQGSSELLWLHIGRPNDLGPFLGLDGDQIAKLDGRAGKRRGTEV